MKTTIENHAVVDYKAVQKDLAELESAKRKAQAKIDDTELEIKNLLVQKSEIETSLATAPDLILEGSLTNAGYKEIEQRLDNINSLINDQNNFAKMFIKKLHDDFSEKTRELLDRLRTKRRMVDVNLAQDLANDIVTKCGTQLEELASLINDEDLQAMPSDLGARDRYMLALGRRLARAAFGGSVHEAEWIPPVKSHELVKAVYKRAGI